MTTDKQRKERTRNFSLTFKEPLSDKMLEELSEEKAFYSKYRNLFKPVKVGSEVVSLIIEDSFEINYSINQKDITARSFVQSDNIVMKKLKVMGDRIAKIFDMTDDSYEITEGSDFKYLEDVCLESWFEDTELIKNIKKEFGGVGDIQLIQIKFVIRDHENDKFISLAYENAEKLDKKQLLIEASKEHLPRILKVLGKNG